MYLARLTLDTRRRETRRILADCHCTHRFVMAGFGSLVRSDARSAMNVLYRLEPGKGFHSNLYVQSSERPDWSRIEAPSILAATGEENPVINSDVDARYASIGEGDRLEFSLVANPTKKVPARAFTEAHPERERPRSSKRCEIREELEQIAWLTRKGERHGFELPEIERAPWDSEVFGEPPLLDDAPIRDVRVRPVARSEGRRTNGEKHTITVYQAQFDGVLRVVDRAAFLDALESGIGPAKAFGCGLLLVRRPGGRASP